jgi:hypothetical protein
MKSLEIYNRYGVAALIPRTRGALTSVIEERVRQAVDDEGASWEGLEATWENVQHEGTRDPGMRTALVALIVQAIRRIEGIDHDDASKE